MTNIVHYTFICIERMRFINHLSYYKHVKPVEYTRFFCRKKSINLYNVPSIICILIYLVVCTVIVNIMR